MPQIITNLLLQKKTETKSFLLYLEEDLLVLVLPSTVRLTLLPSVFSSAEKCICPDISNQMNFGPIPFVCFLAGSDVHGCSVVCVKWTLLNMSLRLCIHLW